MIDDRGFPPPIFTEEGALERYLEGIFGKLSEGGKGSGWFAPPKGTHTKQAKSDHEYALEIIDERIEHGVVVRDGRELFQKAGAHNYIEFSAAEIAAMEDARLIHNHHISSHLSPDDVAFAVQNNLAEIQAVCYMGNGQYSRHCMARPPGGWPDPAELVIAVYSQDNVIYYENLERIQRGLLTKKQAEYGHYIRLWGRISQQFGLIYEREVVDFDEDNSR